MDTILFVVVCMIIAGVWAYIDDKGKAEKAYNELPNTIPDDKLERIYERCEERGLGSFEEDSEKIIQVIRNIVLNNNIDAEQAKKIYLRSVKHVLGKALAENQATYEEEKLKSGIVGKDKYRYGLLEELDKLENQLDNVGAVTDALSMGVMQPKAKNPVASATVTGAILGPAAGVAAANKAQAQNAKAQDTYNSLQATLAESRRLEYQSAIRAEMGVTAIKDYLKKIDGIEIDTSKPSLYFSYIKLSVVNISVSISRQYLAVEMFSDMDNENESIPESFWDEYGNVDGSVKLIAKYDGSLIGTGYLCAPGFGGRALYSYDTIYSISDNGYGFDSCYDLNALVKLDKEWDRDWDVSKVKIEFEPINIWVRTR